MLGLRWTLGVVTAIIACGWVALAIGGGGFRRSFGGSGNPAWMIGLPVLVGALVIASLLWPERRTLLHVVAVVVLLMVVGSVAVARESAFVAAVGVLYALAWLSFYYRTVRS